MEPFWGKIGLCLPYIMLQLAQILYKSSTVFLFSVAKQGGALESNHFKIPKVQLLCTTDSPP